MPTFGSIIPSTEVAVARGRPKAVADARLIDDTPPRIYDIEPVERRELTPAELHMQTVVAASDDAYLMWLSAWNNELPDHICNELYRAYQAAYQYAIEVIDATWQRATPAVVAAPADP